MKNYFTGVVNGLQYLAVTLQPDTTLQYIQLALSIISTLVILGFKIWQWWKEASADGEITAEEIEKGAEIVEKGAKDINDDLKGK